MMLLNTSLLREKFEITTEKNKDNPIIARGNRILLSLVSKNGEFSERFIVRARSMHLALRMAGAITESFYHIGPLLNRVKPFPWRDIWYDISGEFDRSHFDQTWVSVYHKGRPIYKDGHYHAFLDVIEQCDIQNRAEYDKAVDIAIDLAKQTGQNITINHDVNIAAVLGTTDIQSRCGLILRAAQHPSTFNFTLRAHSKAKHHRVKPHDCFTMTAAFLEAIELSYAIGRLNKQLLNEEITEGSRQSRFLHAGRMRIGKLNQLIDSYESTHTMKYRVEKPDFIALMRQAEKE